jgi:hypothetical protein
MFLVWFVLVPVLLLAWLDGHIERRNRESKR